MRSLKDWRGFVLNFIFCPFCSMGVLLTFKSLMFALPAVPLQPCWLPDTWFSYQDHQDVWLKVNVLLFPPIYSKSAAGTMARVYPSVTLAEGRWCLIPALLSVCVGLNAFSPGAIRALAPQGCYSANTCPPFSAYQRLNRTGGGRGFPISCSLRRHIPATYNNRTHKC